MKKLSGQEAVDSFWARSAFVASGCREWQGSVDTGGYGNAWFGSRCQRAHRVAWALTNGPIPKGEGYHGICVLHRCDNRKCVNPRHLFLGTQQANIDDQIAKARFSARGGSRNGRAKLTEDDVRAIRADRRRRKEIASEYAIGVSAIADIRSGRRWGHLS